MLKESPLSSLLRASIVGVVAAAIAGGILACLIWEDRIWPVVAGAGVGGTIAGVAAMIWLRRRVVVPMKHLGELADIVSAYRHNRQIRYYSPLPEIRALADALENSRAVFADEAALLKRDRDAFEAVLGALHAGVVALNSEVEIVRLNPAASFILGVPENAVGKPLADFVRLPELFSLHHESMDDRQPHRASVNDFRGRALSIDAIPLMLPGKDEREGVLLVIHDETELRRLESVRRDFVANVSHELKTPLTSISGYVETLLEGAADDPNVRDSFLGKILSNAGRLRNLSTDLLTLARLESVENNETEASFSPANRVANVIAALEDKAKAKKISVFNRVTSVSVRVTGDAAAYEQAIYNLVDNAINYTPDEGEITLTETLGPKTIAISVSDTGVGIPESEQPRVFERFYRVDKVRSRQLSGTGLGLSIVRHVANSLGGDVSLESTVGKGTTFTLTCPTIQKVES